MNESRLSGIGMTSQRTRERLIGRLQDQGIRDLQVLDAIRNTPRHLFVDEALAHRAYEDTALPIGHSQTISQPYIVAHMTELLLEGGPLNRVLEIGTGSGYQTAILSSFAQEVFYIFVLCIFGRAYPVFFDLTSLTCTINNSYKGTEILFHLLRDH